MTRRSIVRMAPCFAAVVLLLPLLAALAQAQGVISGQPIMPPLPQSPFNGLNGTEIPVFEHSNNAAILRLAVYAEDGKTRLGRQSLVKVTNQTAQTVNWQTTNDSSEAAFELLFGRYEIEVSAVGYLSEHQEIQIATAIKTFPLEVSLHRDPTAVNLDVIDATMPARARKEAKHAVSDLKSGNLKDARKSLDKAYPLAPSNSDLNFLFGYLSYQEKDFAQAGTYLGTAARLNPRNVQALTLLGRTALIQKDYSTAESALGKAVEADNDYWMAHNLLADAYLSQKKYQLAQQQAQLAIAKGKPNATAAHLTLGLALVNLGKKEEGIQSLKTFVHDSPQNPTTPQVLDLIERLERPAAAPAGTAGATLKPAALTDVDPLQASPAATISVKPWKPADIDELKPPVAAGVSCPYDRVMQMSGERVQDLADNVSRIAAIEHLLHERMDEMGNIERRETRDFDYVASVSEQQGGYVGIDEYRIGRVGLSDFPDNIASSGYAALALVFHPNIRENFEMTCEGLGDWHGKAAWLVHFKQRPDKPARIHAVRIGGEDYSMRLKGRAWITADKFEIVRIESDLLAPVPEILLNSEHQAVDYGPIPFPKKNLELWLPTSAEFYFDFRKRRYYRRHTFDHYMLFSVDAAEKRKAQAPPPDSAEKPLPN